MTDASSHNSLIIYCDGACSGNPGPGGWGAVLLYGNHQKHLAGYEAHTTNNRMELTAAIEGLRAVKRKLPVAIYTDSQYVKNGITKWIHSWLRNNWRNDSIKNVDLWQELHKLTQEHTVEWHWVKGHNGGQYNELADSLARAAIKNASIKNAG